jgi:hypothetical protein
MNIKPIQKYVDNLSFEKIISMAELSLREYKEYKARAKSPIENKKIVRECFIVLKLCKEIEKLKREIGIRG